MKKYLLFIYIIIIFNVCYLTPLFIVADIFLQVFAFLGVFSIVRNRYVQKKPHRYMILLLAATVIISIGSSVISLGQDFLSAVIATRHLLKGFSVFFFLPFLEKGQVNLKKVLNMVLRFSWVFAGLVAVVSVLRWTYVFISPLSEVSIEVTGAKYDKSIIFFAIIYYLTYYFKNNHLRSLLYALILFTTTQLYDIQRGDFVFMGLIFMVIFLKHRNSVSSRKMLLFSPIVGVLLIVGIGSVDTSIFQQKFQQMFLLLDSDAYGTIDDASIFVRISEADVAMTGFSNSPIFGNGLIRASKKVALIGDVYFYPADVGILGIMFTYGVFGLFVFFLAIIYLIRLFNKKLGFWQYVFFVNALYMIIYSFKDGSIIFYPALFIFCLLIISMLKGEVFQKIAKKDLGRVRKTNFL